MGANVKFAVGVLHTELARPASANMFRQAQQLFAAMYDQASKCGDRAL
jgi:hypothetical protein